MSKRCELQKEYYQANGKYNDDYVRWLEDQVLALRIHDVVGRSEQLVCEKCKELLVEPYAERYGKKVCLGCM